MTFMSTPAPTPGPLDDETSPSDSYGVTDIGGRDLTWWVVGVTFVGALVMIAIGIGAATGAAKFLCFGAAVLLVIVSLGYAVLRGAIGWLDRHGPATDATTPNGTTPGSRP